MNRAVIYARVSTDDQAKRGFSLPEQLDDCRQYAASHGYAVIAEFSEDFTGTKLDRPELDKVRDMAEHRAFNVLIVRDIDRLARGMAKQIILEEEFKKCGVSIEYVLAQFDDSPTGRLQKNVRAVFAEYQRDYIVEAGKWGRRGRAKKGLVNPSGLDPYGYEYKDNSYKVIPEEAAIVLQIFDWYVNGNMGVTDIARRLSEMGIPTRVDTAGEGHGYRKKQAIGQWSAPHITKMLHKTIYKGDHYDNRHYRDDNGHRKTRPQSEWILVPVEATVPADLWEAAQRKCEKNKADSRRNTQHNYLMRGRLRCATCGNLCYCASPDKRYKAGVPRYRCRRRNIPPYTVQSTNCSETIRVDVVDDAIWGEVCNFLKSPKAIIRLMVRRRVNAQEDASKLKEQIADIDNRLAKENARRDKYVETFAWGHIGKEKLEKKLSEVDRKIRIIEVEKREAEIDLAHMSDSGLPDIDDDDGWDAFGNEAEIYAAEWRGNVDIISDVFAYKRATIEKFDIKGRIDWNTHEIALTGRIPLGVVKLPGFDERPTTRSLPKYVWPFTLTVQLNSPYFHKQHSEKGR